MRQSPEQFAKSLQGMSLDTAAGEVQRMFYDNPDWTEEERWQAVALVLADIVRTIKWPT